MLHQKNPQTKPNPPNPEQEEPVPPGTAPPGSGPPLQAAPAAAASRDGGGGLTLNRGHSCSGGPGSRSGRGRSTPQVAGRSPPLGCAQTRPQHVTYQSLLHSKLTKLCPPGPRPRTLTPLLITQLTGYADSHKEEL